MAGDESTALIDEDEAGAGGSLVDGADVACSAVHDSNKRMREDVMALPF